MRVASFSTKISNVEGKRLKIRLGGIVPLSTIDYSGHAAMVIFMGGCNFRCPYCYNSRMLDLADCPERGIAEVEAEIDRARGLISGVVFSGGEPTCQPRQLSHLARFARSKGLAVKLDTNGSLPDVIENMFKSRLVDHIAVDVKAPLKPKKYARLTGISDASTIANLKRTLRLPHGDVVLEARTTFVPSMLSEGDIREMAKSIECDFYALQQFRPEPTVLDPSLRKLNPPPRELMLKLAQIAKEAGQTDVLIRTVEGGEEKV